MHFILFYVSLCDFITVLLSIVYCVLFFVCIFTVLYCCFGVINDNNICTRVILTYAQFKFLLADLTKKLQLADFNEI